MGSDPMEQWMGWNSKEFTRAILIVSTLCMLFCDGRNKKNNYVLTTGIGLIQIRIYTMNYLK